MQTTVPCDRVSLTLAVLKPCVYARARNETLVLSSFSCDLSRGPVLGSFPSFGRQKCGTTPRQLSAAWECRSRPGAHQRLRFATCSSVCRRSSSTVSFFFIRPFRNRSEKHVDGAANAWAEGIVKEFGIGFFFSPLYATTFHHLLPAPVSNCRDER